VRQTRALLLANRKARRGGEGLIQEQSILRAAGWSLQVEIPEDPEHIPSVIRERGRDFDLVILAGGDGTLNHAAAALVETGVPLGILPQGTANDLARTLQIPDDPAAACEIIIAGRTSPIDLGRVNGHYFFNVASTGLSVRVTRELSHEVKKRWGVFGYLGSLVQAVQVNRPFALEVVCDGEVHIMRSIQVSIGNGRHYGGGMTVAADAEIDDQLLHLYSLEPVGICGLAALALALRTGRYAHTEKVRTLQGREFRLRTKKTMPIDVDGELITRTPAHFEVVPHALEVFVPAAYTQTGET